MRAQPLCHTMLVSEITPTVDVGACMRALHKSQWGIPAERIYLHKLSFVSYACGYIVYIVLQVCKTRYDGELSLGINDINGQHVIGADVTFQHVTEQAFHKILYSNLSIGSSNHHC